MRIETEDVLTGSKLALGQIKGMIGAFAPRRQIERQRSCIPRGSGGNQVRPDPERLILAARRVQRFGQYPLNFRHGTSVGGSSQRKKGFCHPPGCEQDASSREQGPCVIALESQSRFPTPGERYRPTPPGSSYSARRA